MNSAQLRRQLEAGLHTLLTNNTGFTWGKGERPDTGAKPYGIIYILDAIAPDSWQDLLEIDQPAKCTVQLTLVGITQEQVLWASSKAVIAITNRSAGGAYTNTLSVSGATVISRTMLQAGPVIRQGEALYNGADTYSFLLEGT